VIYLLVNAIVHTMDDSLPVSQALAVKDGRIVEIGGTDEILWLREDDYELIDLEGQTVVPGTMDGDRAYTIRGTLAPGRPAEFLVLSADPLAEPPVNFSAVRVREAWADGSRVLVREAASG
jgi:predicted amidohydrolase YtcJ